MIIGIGVDTVDIERLGRQLGRAGGLLARLFTEREAGLPLASLAARFAAKEALIKALGGSGALGWHDLEVPRIPGRAPGFARTPGLSRELALRGAGRVHLSLSHDGGIATAFVIVEASGPETGSTPDRSGREAL
ncbi:holo-ACP synthase [Leucobacter weissii]|uniref:Holo-[acyl-carrier-protein] synthase n=1 Tax=Leucobacter weissii TaxID=1983706 RepID=A0A939MLN3_9MICO|nr:holo-ACP synthase [Leucobacter weissii]MBO1903038.1 holo-ACP synthase [Leucobacter weissii]